MDRLHRIYAEGASALSESDLVHMLLGSGARDAFAAARIAARGLDHLRRATPGELLREHGLRPDRAGRLVAALELGRRALFARTSPRPRLLGAEACVERLWPLLVHLRHEEFWALLLTARCEEMRAVRVSAGGLSQCSVLPREAFAPALVHAAPCVVFAHNHPSGDPDPSADDRRLELLLEEAGRALGVRVLDQLVVAEAGAHSARQGTIPLPASLAPRGPR